MSPRQIEPEWLDVLPPGEPRAIRSRADLRRVNGLMGNARFIASCLRKEFAEGKRTLRFADLGAGDASLALAIARHLRRGRVRLTLVDRTPAVRRITLEKLAALGWQARIARSDVFEFLGGAERFDAIFANLFLHHFDDARLARVLALAAARTRVFVACEPRRSRPALAGSRLLWLLGCNDVTRHDAIASVRAGFCNSELTELFPKTSGWRIAERFAPPFGHLFCACAATPW